ncbi:hypothetical protein [Cellulomonas sp. P5_C5]
MRSPVALTRPADLPMLVVAAAALGVAFVVAPRTLAASPSSGGFAGRSDLTDAARRAFTEFWAGGGSVLSPALDGVVDYWFRYHLAKAVLAAALLAVLVVLGAHLWRAFLGASGLRGVVLATAGVVVSALALFSTAVVMANVQGAVAPFASLLPTVVVGAPQGDVTAALDEVRHQLSGPGSSPALDVMVRDFGTFHTALALVAAVVAVVLVGGSVALLRRCAAVPRTERRTRRTFGAAGVVGGLLALAFVVVALANAGTAADPAPALLAFVEGGW